MSRQKPSKKKPATARRSGKSRREAKRRRIKVMPRDNDQRGIRDLYKTDLDRHFWSWASPSARNRRRKARARRRRRRTLAGIIASAAGALGAAGLSYALYRRLKEDDRPLDPEYAEADLDEADFE